MSEVPQDLLNAIVAELSLDTITEWDGMGCPEFQLRNILDSTVQHWVVALRDPEDAFAYLSAILRSTDGSWDRYQALTRSTVDWRLIQGLPADPPSGFHGLLNEWMKSVVWQKVLPLSVSLGRQCESAS